MSGVERLEFRDGTSGYQYGEADRRKAAAGSWEYANREPVAGISWDVDSVDDDDHAEGDLITVDVATLVELMRLARIGAQYAGCSTCRRVTLV
jgi:hypothetical protein